MKAFTKQRRYQGQETFLVPSGNKQTRNYDTRALKPPSLPINTEAKRIEP